MLKKNQYFYLQLFLMCFLTVFMRLTFATANINS